jgi:TonB-dependent SusC/RagA subfamily outer membrane receptor
MLNAFYATPFFKRRIILKTLRIMNITGILLLACCLQVSAKAYSQTVTLHLENAPLNKVFQEIKGQTGYTFMYTGTMLKEAKKVSISVKNFSLQQALNLCFTGQPFTYTIIDKTVVLHPREKAVENDNSSITALPPPPVEIHGRVVNKAGSPLQGVSVFIAGSQKGTITNRDGRFTLMVPDGENITLEVSSVGYQTKKIDVGRQTEITITLDENVSGLSDVVVIGYGTTSKKDLTGSVSQVKSEALESAPVYDIGEALKGHSSGVQVTNNSGAPGSRIQVRIRGGNSMIGSNTPLYVVDGFPVVGGIDFLNPSDIESINILKDASATAIYGSRGANGVVIITSKRGKKGQKGLISINSYYGEQWKTHVN